MAQISISKIEKNRLGKIPYFPFLKTYKWKCKLIFKSNHLLLLNWCFFNHKLKMIDGKSFYDIIGIEYNVTILIFILLNHNFFLKNIVWDERRFWYSFTAIGKLARNVLFVGRLNYYYVINFMFVFWKILELFLSVFSLLNFWSIYHFERLIESGKNRFYLISFVFICRRSLDIIVKLRK